MGLNGSKYPSEARILMLGLDGSGKSTLLYKLKYNKTVVTVPTVGFNVEMLETQDKSFVLTVFDVGGQHQMRVHWEHYYQDTAGLVFVVDSKNKTRMTEARQELERILGNKSLKVIPLIVLANKQDLSGALRMQELAEILNLKDICGNRHWCLQSCSAKTGAGLKECFHMMVQFLKTTGAEVDEEKKEIIKRKI